MKCTPPIFKMHDIEYKHRYEQKDDCPHGTKYYMDKNTKTH